MQFLVHMRLVLLLPLVTFVLFVTPAQARLEPEAVRLTPLDRVNEQNMQFNDWLIVSVFDPAARSYNWTVPKWGQRRVSSILRNLMGPRDIVNSLLQGKLHRASVHFARFAADTVFGLGGAFEIGVPVLKLRAPPETFNETLGSYRVGTGPFLIIPMIGETSPRALTGSLGDALLYPLGWLPPAGPGNTASMGGRMFEGMGSMSARMPPRGSPSEAWIPYENVRDALISTPYDERKRLYFENERWDVER